MANGRMSYGEWKRMRERGGGGVGGAVSTCVRILVGELPKKELLSQNTSDKLSFV